MKRVAKFQEKNWWGVSRDMIMPDYFYAIYPKPMEILGKFWFFKILEKFGFFWKILVWHMIWQDHVFNYGPKSATRVTKLRKKNWRGASRNSFVSKFCHLRSRFWEPKFKTWSRQIMFYVIYPDPTCLPALIFYGRTACYDWTSKCPNKGIRVAYFCISYNLRLTKTFKINNALISMAITHHWRDNLKNWKLVETN